MKDVENNEVDVIKIAAREMLKGSKMLGEHCKVCGFPLFEDIKGNKYCVYCKVMKKREEKERDDIIEINKEDKKDTMPFYSKDTGIKILERKIDYLFKKLDEEYDVARIMEITDTIKALLKLKSKLEKR
ncbi:MAG TPA: hypothetical protein EYH53_00860 [Methanothermococcus okinawensis]|nr:hypothetical protein [Methanothermococcus okinawensis]